jgi:hypothetical protein
MRCLQKELSLRIDPRPDKRVEVPVEDGVKGVQSYRGSTTDDGSDLRSM